MNLRQNAVGIGLRAPHFDAILNELPNIDFLEIHSENYFGGGKPKEYLSKLAQNYPISMHSVGLSLGSENLDFKHLRQIKNLIDEFNPILVSDHLSFSGDDGIYVPDLLPVPLIDETMDKFVRNIDLFQNFIGRQILIENPSNYLSFKNSTFTEADFLNKICEKTGCAILLDINNIYVGEHNIGLNSNEYIDSINPLFVKEIHLAGYQENKTKNGETILIDTHGNTVFPKVWDLFETAIKKFNAPVLIEWDTNIPPLEILLGERKKALNILEAQNA